MVKDKRLKTPLAAAAPAGVEKDAPPPVSADAVPRTPSSPRASDATIGSLLSLHDLRSIFGSRDATSDDAKASPPPSTAEAFERLQLALGVQHVGANARSAAWVDFCFGVLCFARSSESYGANVPRFCDGSGSGSDEKALLVLAIADDVFQFATTPAAATDSRLPTLEQCYDRFRERVRDASRLPPFERSSSTSDGTIEPPPRPPLLTTREVASFVAFMSTTFFRHLGAYQLLMSRPRASVTRRVELCVESPLPPAPLASATQTDA